MHVLTTYAMTDVSHGRGQDLRSYSIRGSIVVSISACHAEDPGSIPGRGGFLLTLHIMHVVLIAKRVAILKSTNYQQTSSCCMLLMQAKEIRALQLAKAPPSLPSTSLQKEACRDPGSNRGPSDLQSDALPTELSRLIAADVKIMFSDSVAMSK